MQPGTLPGKQENTPSFIGDLSAHPQLPPPQKNEALWRSFVGIIVVNIPLIRLEFLGENGIGWVRVPLKFPLFPGQFQWGLAWLFAVGFLPGTAGRSRSQQCLARWSSSMELPGRGYWIGEMCGNRSIIYDYMYTHMQMNVFVVWMYFWIFVHLFIYIYSTCKYVKSQHIMTKEGHDFQTFQAVFLFWMLFSNVFTLSRNRFLFTANICVVVVVVVVVVVGHHHYPSLFLGKKQDFRSLATPWPPRLAQDKPKVWLWRSCWI